jgi:uncharacterized protein YbjQ (UPF0145 family)
VEEDDSDTLLAKWSWYTKIPSKAYNPVGIIVLRKVTYPAYDMMEAVKALGGDDYINVRVDTSKRSNGALTILAISAMAIKYTDEVYEPYKQFISGEGQSSDTNEMKIVGLYPLEVERGEQSLGTNEVKWSNYTYVDNKNFKVLGIVTANCENSATPAADLMEAAKALNADDIFRVRIDTVPDPKTKKLVVKAASAIAIKYTTSIDIYEYVPPQEEPELLPAAGSTDNSGGSAAPLPKKKIMGIF